jgi:hypothetical protein
MNALINYLGAITRKEQSWGEKGTGKGKGKGLLISQGNGGGPGCCRKEEELRKEERTMSQGNTEGRSRKKGKYLRKEEE